MMPAPDAVNRLISSIAYEHLLEQSFSSCTEGWQLALDRRLAVEVMEDCLSNRITVSDGAILCAILPEMTSTYIGLVAMTNLPVSLAAAELQRFREPNWSKPLPVYDVFAGTIRQ